MNGEKLFGEVKDKLTMETQKLNEEIASKKQREERAKILELKESKKTNEILKPLIELNTRNTRIINTVRKFTDHGQKWDDYTTGNRLKKQGRIVILKEIDTYSTAFCLVSAAVTQYSSSDNRARFMFGFLSPSEAKASKDITYDIPLTFNADELQVQHEESFLLDQTLILPIGNDISPNNKQPLKFGVLTNFFYKQALANREAITTENEQSLAMVMEAASNIELNPHLDEESRNVAITYIASLARENQ